jgi:hypothetical protein
MDVLRWFTLAIALVAPLATIEVVVAQEWHYSELTQSFVVGANREFRTSKYSVSGGPTKLLSVVYQFDSPTSAEHGMHFVEDFLLHNATERDGAIARRVSVPVIGDDRIAYALSLDDEIGASPLESGVLIWQEESVICVLISAGEYGDQVALLFEVAQSMSGPNTSPASTSRQSGEPRMMRHGGIYNWLPSLSNLPNGWSFVSEQDAELPKAWATPSPDVVASPALPTPPTAP